MPYQPILDTEIAAGQPLTKGLIERLRDNPLTLITMEPDELTGGGSNTQTTDQNGKYNVPNDVNLLMVICVGGGGGGGSGTASVGGEGGTSGAVKCGFVTTTGGSSISYIIGAAGSAGANGGDTDFGSSVIAKGGLRGSTGSSSPNGFQNGPVSLGGTGGKYGEQRFPTGGSPGTAITANSTYGGGGGGAGVHWFLRSSTLGNGGNATGGSGGNATGRGAGGGGGGINQAGGNGTAGIIFVFPLQG
jgi:hypothetical protein